MQAYLKPLVFEFKSWLNPLLNPVAYLSDVLHASDPEGEDVQGLLRRLEQVLQKPAIQGASGEKRSFGRGQGLDFAELREYMPGDDIRKMDWSVFARTLTPHVREYHEEKHLTVWLVLDLTASMRFGQHFGKHRILIELVGLLTIMVNRAHHRFGAFIIGDTGTHIIPPHTGKAQVHRVMEYLLEWEKTLQTNDFATQRKMFGEAFTQLAPLIQKNSMVFVISDFLDNPADWEHALGQISQKVQLLSVMLQDPVELQIPQNIGILTFRDSETDQWVEVDTHDAAFHQAYCQRVEAEQEMRRRILQRMGGVALVSTQGLIKDILEQVLQAASGNLTYSGRSPADSGKGEKSS